MLSGLRRGLGTATGPTPVCPKPDLRKRPSIYDKVVPRGPSGTPVYDPDVPYTHDIDMYPAGAAPSAPWMWGGASFGSTFPQAVPRDFPASLMPRLDAIGVQSTWHLGQVGKMLSGRLSALPTIALPVRQTVVLAKPKYSYDVALFQRELISHLGPLGGTEFNEHYWAGNTTNAMLRVLPDTIEVEVRDPRTGAFPVWSDKAKTVEITIVSGSAEEFRRLFPSEMAQVITPGTSSDIPNVIDEATVRRLMAACTSGTYGQQVNCMIAALASEYGVSRTSADGDALYQALLQGLDLVHREDAEAPQGIVSFEADTAAQEAASKNAPPAPIYQPEAAVTVPNGNLVFTETGLPEDLEKAPESFSDYARKNPWVKWAAIGVGGLGALAIVSSILRRR
jgi:hypothetical protein